MVSTSRERPNQLLEEEQEARSFLRERFLKAVNHKGIMNKKCEFHLHENIKVSAEFCGCDVQVSRFAVENLETNIGKVPYAILRANDIIRIRMPEAFKLQDVIEKPNTITTETVASANTSRNSTTDKESYAQCDSTGVTDN